MVSQRAPFLWGLTSSEYRRSASRRVLTLPAPVPRMALSSVDRRAAQVVARALVSCVLLSR